MAKTPLKAAAARRKDPLRTPRELAEILLGHPEIKRSKVEIRRAQRRIQQACRIYNPKFEEGRFFGLHSLREPTGRRLILESEAVKWADRTGAWRVVERVLY